jgi:hypothetical protein
MERNPKETGKWHDEGCLAMVWDVDGFPCVCHRQDKRWWLLRLKRDVVLDQEQTPLEVYPHYLSPPLPLGQLKHAVINKGIVLSCDILWSEE